MKIGFLQNRNQIYGILAIWIICFHIYNKVGVPFGDSLVGRFFSIGNCCVDVFMFLSGYCVCLSYKKDSNLQHFFQRRISRVLIPYLLIAIPFFVWKSICRMPPVTGFFNLKLFIKDITGISLFLHNTTTVWFVVAILIFYLIFPLVFRIIKINKIWPCLFLGIYITLILVFWHLNFPLYKNSAIIFTRFPSFVIGAYMAYYSIDLPKNRIIQIVSVFYLLFFVFVFNIRENLHLYFGSRFGTPLWLFYLSFIFPLLTFFSRTKSFGKTFETIGNISLEVYLIHVLLLNILQFYGGIEVLGYWLYIIIPFISILISLVVSKYSKLLIRKN